MHSDYYNTSYEFYCPFSSWTPLKTFYIAHAQLDFANELITWFCWNMASSKSVSFAEELEETAAESGDSCDSTSSSESHVPDYVESFSEGELWSSSDEDHAELFEHVLESAYHGRHASRLDPAEMTSLLLSDKDILQREAEGETKLCVTGIHL